MTLFTDALKDPTFNWVYLYDLYPWDVSADAVVTEPLLLSNKPYGTGPNDTLVSRQYRPHARKFSITRTLFSGDSISRNAKTTYSDLRITNTPDPLSGVAYYDAWLEDYIFDGYRIVIRKGHASWNVDDFGVLFDGLMDGKPEPGRKELTIRVADKRRLLDQLPMVPKYQGVEDCLEFDYNGSVSPGFTRRLGTVANSANINVNSAFVCMMDVKVLGTADQPASSHILSMLHGVTTPLEYPWSLTLFGQNTLDSIQMGIRWTHSSGTLQTQFSSFTFDHDVWNTLIWRIDANGRVDFAVVNIDSHVDSSDKHATMTWEQGTSAAGTRDVVSDAGGYSLIGASDIQVKNLRWWDDEGWPTSEVDALGFYAFRRGIERMVNSPQMSATAELGSGLTKGTIQLYLRCDEGTGATVGDSSSNGYDYTSAANYSWSHPLKGNPEVEGLPMPISIGDVRIIKPVLIDKNKLIYQWHPVESSAVTTGPTENGGAIVADTGQAGWGGSSNAPSLSAFTSVTVTANQYVTYLAESMMRLGSTPSGEIRLEWIKGDVPRGEGIFSNRLMPMVKKLLWGFGPLVNADFDSTSYSALNTILTPYIGGLYIHPLEKKKLQEWLNEVLICAHAFSFWNRSNELAFGQMAAPADTPDWKIARHMIKTIRRVKLRPPDRSLRMSFRRTWQTISDSNLATGLSLEDKKYYTDTHRWVSKTEYGIAKKYAGSKDGEDIITILRQGDHADTLLDQWMEIYSAPGRRMFDIELKSLPGLVELGDTVELTYPRYGMSDGWLCRVIEWSDGERNRVKLWG